MSEPKAEYKMSEEDEQRFELEERMKFDFRALLTMTYEAGYQEGLKDGVGKRDG